MSDPSTPRRPDTAADPPEVLARITEGLEVVRYLAHQLQRNLAPYSNVDELMSHGREALLAAARSFQPDLGVPFRRWANLRVRGAMIDAMRAEGALPRRVYQQLRAMEAADRVYDVAAEEEAASPVASAEAADAKLSESLGSAAMAMALALLAEQRGGGSVTADPPDPRGDPEEQLGRSELFAAVRAAIASRPEAERRLLERHYFDGATFEQAAGELGLSKSWASRLHVRALEGVARALRRGRVEPT